MEPALDIDRVEWLSGSPESVVVRVIGRWQGAGSLEDPVLVIEDDGRQHAFVAHEPPARRPGAEGQTLWSASFSIPIELRPRLEEGIAIEFGGQRLGLPRAVAGAEAGAAAQAASAQVIDRAVLAERRARRAELNERSLGGRLQETEATVRTLEAQLVNVEQRLERANREREETERELTQRENEIRLAKQREYAEQQLRVEAETRSSQIEHEAGTKVEELRRRLDLAQSEAFGLGEEVEGVRRQLAEAHQEAATERAAVRRARDELAQRESDLAQREHRFSEAEQAPGSIGAGGASRTLRKEEDAGMLPEQLGKELSALREELLRLQASAVEQVERNQVADRMLAELEAALRALQSELATLRRDKDDAERECDRLRRVLAAREETIERLQRAATQLEGRPGAGQALTQLLASLRAVVGALRNAFDRERGAWQEAVVDERERHLRQLMLLERRLSSLRAEMNRKTTALTAELEAERRRSPPAEPRPSPAAGPPPAGGSTPPTAAGAPKALPAQLDALRRRLDGVLEGSAQAGVAVPPAAASLRDRADMAQALAEAVVRLRARVDEAREGALGGDAGRDGAHEEPPERASEGAASHVATQTATVTAPPTPWRRWLRRRRSASVNGATAAQSPVDQTEATPAEGGVTADSAAAAVPPVQEGKKLTPRVVDDPRRGSRTPWLANAIRGLAVRRDPALAAELIVELLPAQGLVINRPLRYELTIEDFATLGIGIEGGAPAVVSRDFGSSPAEPDLSIAGPAAALAELAAGGAHRRLPDVDVDGPRRTTRMLTKALKRPLGLADLVAAGITIWPGLLLAALEQAIDPAWTTGQRLLVTWAIEGQPGALVHVEVRDGEPVTVTASQPARAADATVRLSERAFLFLIAGVALPEDEVVMLAGDAAAVDALLALTDRAQGLDGNAG